VAASNPGLGLIADIVLTALPLLGSPTGGINACYGCAVAGDPDLTAVPPVTSPFFRMMAESAGRMCCRSGRKDRLAAWTCALARCGSPADAPAYVSAAQQQHESAQYHYAYAEPGDPWTSRITPS
jgi:hypothetical protein